MTQRVIAGVLILCLCLSSGIPTALTANYDLHVSGSTDIPTRTVTYDGETHEVDAIAEAAPGDTLSISVSAPSDANYRVNLYNGNRQIEDQQSGTGNSDVQFDLTGYEPGSYMLFLYEDGDYKDILPVVISGYDVTIQSPKTAYTESEKTIEASLSKLTDVEDPYAVELVLANTSYSQRVSMEQRDSETYRGTVSLQDVAPGEYRVYAVVQGSDTAFKEGRKELLGISDASSLTVKTQETTQKSSNPPAGPTTETTSPTKTVTTKETASTASSTPKTTTTVETTLTTTVQSSQSTIAETVTSTTDSVITPATIQKTSDESTNHDAPVNGFTVELSLIALLGTLYLTFRRRP